MEPPGLEPGISACKAEVLANYTMTPLISYQRTLNKSYIRVGFEPTTSKFYFGILPLNYPFMAKEVTLIYTIETFVANSGVEPDIS